MTIVTDDPSLPQANTSQWDIDMDTSCVCTCTQIVIGMELQSPCLSCCVAELLSRLQCWDLAIEGLGQAVSNPQRVKRECAEPKCRISLVSIPKGHTHTGLFSWKESCHQADNGFTIFIPRFREEGGGGGGGGSSPVPFRCYVYTGLHQLVQPMKPRGEAIKESLTHSQHFFPSPPVSSCLPTFFIWSKGPPSFIQYTS